MKIMMVGEPTDPTGDFFREDKGHGGPFCVSFHKSKSYRWENECGGDDEGMHDDILSFFKFD